MFLEIMISLAILSLISIAINGSGARYGNPPEDE